MKLKLTLVLILGSSVFIQCQDLNEPSRPAEETDNIPPQVLYVSPEDSAEASIDSKISVRFSEPIGDSDKYLKWISVVGNREVTGSIFVDGDALHYSPDSLVYSTWYTVDLNTNVVDTAGNHLEKAFEWRFFTESKPDDPDTNITEQDTIPPYVLSVSPNNASGEVSVETSLKVSLSEPVKNESGNGIILESSSDSVAGRITIESTEITFIPGSSLEYETTYTATVTTSVTDTAGNSLEKEFSWYFVTEDIPPDVTPPEVVSVFPEDGTRDVSVDTRIYAVFSENINAADGDMYMNRIQLGESPDVSGEIICRGDTVEFMPNSTLTQGTSYAVVLATNITDESGNNLLEEFEWVFVTAGEAPWKINGNYGNYKIQRIDNDEQGNIYVDGRFNGPNDDTDYFLAKFNSNGELVEFEEFISENHDYAGQTTAFKFRNGALYLIRRDETLLNEIYYVEKRSPDLSLIWQVSVDNHGPGGAIGVGESNFVYAGFYDSNVLAIADDNGTVEESWQEPGSGVDDIEVNSGDIFIAGEMGGSSIDAYLTKRDSWTITYGNPNVYDGFPLIEVSGEHDLIYFVVNTMINGYTPTIRGYNFDGDSVWTEIRPNLGRIQGAALDSDGYLYVVGKWSSSSPSKFGPEGLVWETDDPISSPDWRADVTIFGNTVFVVNSTSRVLRFNKEDGTQIE